MQEIITQKQFLDLYKGGQRLFSNCLMQFFDIADATFENIVFRNCKLLLCTFRNCSFKTCTFEQCTVYSGSFYNGRADDLIFDMCNIEMTLFDNYQFFKSAMKRSNLRWFGMINSPGIDISSSTQFKIITDLSQVSEAEIEELSRMLMGTVERMDLGARLKVKDLIRESIDRYNLAQPEEKKDKYASQADYSDAPLTYGEAKGAVEAFFYGMNTDPYKSKKPYETAGGYKKNNEPNK
ncbi:MAG: pentapeptide repeat-containing protein [Candidatus Aenigmatarchaeota archaeon]